jgi:hypothetical protein
VNVVNNNAVAMESVTGVQTCVGLSLSLLLVEVFNPREGAAIDLTHTHLVTELLA